MDSIENSYGLATPQELASLGGFDTPSAPEAQHLLREVGWGEQLEVLDVNAAAGESPLHLYSLKEAAKFFRFGTAGLGFTTGGSGSVSWAEADQLLDWVERTIGDTALAAALRERFGGQDSYHGVVKSASRLIDLRYTQLSLIAEGA